MTYVLVGIFCFVAGGMIGAASREWIVDKIRIRHSAKELQELRDYLKDQHKRTK